MSSVALVDFRCGVIRIRKKCGVSVELLLSWPPTQ